MEYRFRRSENEKPAKWRAFGTFGHAREEMPITPNNLYGLYDIIQFDPLRVTLLYVPVKGDVRR